MNDIRVPRVQYAFFCEDVVNTPDELTFKKVRDIFLVKEPKYTGLYLVLKLLNNLVKGPHKIGINITDISALLIRTNSFEIDMTSSDIKAGSKLITKYIQGIPFGRAELYLIRITYDDNPLTNFKIPINPISD